MSFDGIDDRILLPTTRDFQMKDGFTVDAWIKVNKNLSSALPIVCTTDGRSLCLFVNGRWSQPKRRND